MTKKSVESAASGAGTSEVWLGAPSNGRPFSVRAVELDNGRVAIVPTRLFVRIFPDLDLQGHRGDGRRGDLEMKIAKSERGIRFPDHLHEPVLSYSGRQVVIDADTTEDGKIEIRAVTVTRASGSVTATDLTKGLRIQEWIEDGLNQATAMLSVTRGEPNDLKGFERWGYGREVGEEIAERARKRPPVGRGRRKPIPAVELAADLYSDGKTFGEIRLILRDQLGVERTERTFRRWIDDAKKDK